MVLHKKDLISDTFDVFGTECYVEFWNDHDRVRIHSVWVGTVDITDCLTNKQWEEINEAVMEREYS